MACEALADSPNLERIAAAIGRQDEGAVVALVGHEPWTGELASLLLAGDSGRLSIDFPKSGVMGLEVGELVAGSAMLAFFLRPKGT
jgi:phosphohistidine phosphatase SixA